MVKGRIRARLAGKDGSKIPTKQCVVVVMVAAAGLERGICSGSPKRRLLIIDLG